MPCDQEGIQAARKKNSLTKENLKNHSFWALGGLKLYLDKQIIRYINIKHYRYTLIDFKEYYTQNQ